MSEDFFRADLEEGYTDEDFKKALILIEDKCLEIAGMSLKELGLFSPDRRSLPTTCPDPIMNIDEAEVEAQKDMMNENQRSVYNAIMTRVQSGDGGIMFIDAPGGTGKTFLTNLIISQVHLNREYAVAVASSGEMIIFYLKSWSTCNNLNIFQE